MTYSDARNLLTKLCEKNPKFKNEYFILPTDNKAKDAFLKHLYYCHQNNLEKKYSDVVIFVNQKDITSDGKFSVLKLNFSKDKITIISL